MLVVEQVLQGRYQLKQRLGQNAGCQTWLAADLDQHHQLVIVKLLALANQVLWDNFKLFEREVQILKQLNHPQIPKHRDDFWIDDGSQLGLVQEYIPGHSLKELLDRGHRFTEQQVRQIALQVLNILIYLHELNPSVLHRDIKPSNLILGEGEQVYLVDFGAVQDRTATLGATLTIVGTYGYSPIEQFGGRVAPASDLYALGATLIHLLTGIAPADLPQRNLQIQFSDLVCSSPSMVRWLQQLTEPALERRFSSARLALEALLSDICPSSSSHLPSILVPEEIKGWNWGAFLLAPLWSLTNHVWLGLLAWVPIVGFWMAIALGIKGNEWAWKSRKWQSIDQFLAHQKRWASAGIVLGIAVNLVVWQLGVLLLLIHLRHFPLSWMSPLA